MNKTHLAKPSEVQRQWYIVDAQGISLGRVSSIVASILRGKNKPNFTPSVDTGDFVIIQNADKVKLTGNKAKDKTYYRHSGHPGGLKSVSAGELLQNNTRKLFENSIKGMLPKTPLGRKQLLKLHVYNSGEEIKQTAQQPKVIDIKGLI